MKLSHRFLGACVVVGLSVPLHAQDKDHNSCPGAKRQIVVDLCVLEQQLSKAPNTKSGKAPNKKPGKLLVYKDQEGNKHRMPQHHEYRLSIKTKDEIVFQCSNHKKKQFVITEFQKISDIGTEDSENPSPQPPGTHGQGKGQAQRDSPFCEKFNGEDIGHVFPSNRKLHTGYPQKNEYQWYKFSFQVDDHSVDPHIVTCPQDTYPGCTQ